MNNRFLIAATNFDDANVSRRGDVYFDRLFINPYILKNKQKGFWYTFS